MVDIENIQDQDFKFFLPFDINKAKDAKGNEVMSIKGIASTIDRDSDDEVLDPNGFELDYLMNYGYLNWHHQSKGDPSAIIGEPTLANITKDGLYIEGTLYDNELGKKVWDLANTLKKSKNGRKLGFSIEGKVLERSPIDKKHITKARVTGVAITPSPKNSSTFLDILKGDIKDYIEDEDILYNFEKSGPNGGDVKIIIDITKDNGDRLLVDKDYNISIVQKSQTTDNSRSIIKEDLENKNNLDKEKKDNKKNIIKSDRDSINNINFEIENKSKIFGVAISVIPDFEKALEFTTKIVSESKNMKTTKLEHNEIIKTFMDLGVEISEDIIKASMNEVVDEEEEDDEDEETKMIKSDLTKKQNEIESLNQKLEEKKKNKSKTANIEKGENGDILSLTHTVGAIIKGFQDEISSLRSLLDKKPETKPDEQVSGNDNIVKSINESISGQFEGFKNLFDEFKTSIEEKIGEIEAYSPGPKSIRTKNFIEKSEKGEGSDRIKLSVSGNKSQILNILQEKSGIDSGKLNERYSDALMMYESSGVIEKSIINELSAQTNIDFVA